MESEEIKQKKWEIALLEKKRDEIDKQIQQSYKELMASKIALASKSPGKSKTRKAVKKAAKKAVKKASKKAAKKAP